MKLYGRDPERARIDALLERARASRSGVLVLRAEAGMGKSALLEYAARAGADLRILRVTGVQPEIGLPYAAMHRLLQPVLPLLDRIPAPQAAALRGALAIGPAEADNRFASALAVLSLLAEATAGGPVLCLVDDAQWLDSPTADALTFVGRRLDAEGIVLLLAVREGDTRSDPAAGLPELRLTGLHDEAAEDLLVWQFGAAIAPAVRRAIRTAGQGNPLALLEIPTVLSSEQLIGHRTLPDPMPLGSELERILLEQVRRLGPDAQSLLLVAAAEQETSVVLEAAARLGVPDAALIEAEMSGLIRRRGGELVFRHPILRTATYQGAAPAERRATHQALAEVLPDEQDADRRAWHRAALAGRHDDAIADELEETAGRARRRGGHAAAAAALRRAADLSSGVARARRLAGAARAAWDAGWPDEARALLRLVETPPEQETYAELRHLEGELELRCGLPAEGAKVLLDGAAAAAATNPPQALRMLLDAAMCAIYAGDRTALTEAVRVSRTLPPERLGDARPLVSVLDAVAGMMIERPAGPESLVRYLDEVGESSDPQALIWAGAAATAIGDPIRQDTLRRRAEMIARRSTQVGTLAMVLERIAWMEMTNGQVAAAAMHAAEGLGLAREAALTNSACFHRAVLSWVSAVRGDQDECLALAEQAAETARSHGLAPHLAIASWAVGLHHLGHARWAEAVVRLTGMAAPGGHPYVTMLALPDLVEAAVRAGQAHTARQATDRYLAYAGIGAPPWRRALAARCRALTGPVRERRELLTEALALHGRDPRPFGRARTQLLLGEHLRRERHRAEARPCLMEAAETFEALGAAPWAARALAELRATGETPRRRASNELTQLTPQQAQITRMVAGGATNKEVAAQLFLSPRTVDYHLHNVFVKLGVGSRGDLMRLDLGDPA